MDTPLTPDTSSDTHTADDPWMSPSVAPSSTSATGRKGGQGEWFGLVRGPVPGVEVLPVVCSDQLGVMPLNEFAREWAAACISVTEALRTYEAEEFDKYFRDRLEAAQYGYEVYEEAFNALSDLSLGCLVRVLMGIGRRSGDEWVAGQWAGLAELRSAWQEGTAGAHVELGRWLADEVVQGWGSGDRWSTIAVIPHAETVIVAGRAMDHIGLREAVWALLRGIESVALAALQVGAGHLLDCLLSD